MSEQSGGSSTTKPKTRTITLRRGKIVREFPRRVVTKPLCKDKTGFQKPQELVQEVKRLTKDELEEYTSQITKLYNERPDNFGPFWDPDKARISDSLWKINVPEELKIGHEAHFGQVTSNFLTYLEKEELPVWEVPNMISKYYTTIEAYKMAQD